MVTPGPEFFPLGQASALFPHPEAAPSTAHHICVGGSRWHPRPLGVTVLVLVYLLQHLALVDIGVQEESGGSETRVPSTSPRTFRSLGSPLLAEVSLTRQAHLVWVAGQACRVG